MDKIERNEWKYKEKAIKKIAKILISLKQWNQLKEFTWIPVPPSIEKSDPMHDDRLIQTLKIVKEKGPALDYRELVQIKKSRSPAHQTVDPRPNSEDHYFNFIINESLIESPTVPEKTIIYDDVITTGSSYKAMKRALREVYPNSEIIGLFIARTVPLK